ncbi:hypothetical protein FOA52_012022 [Chlamydomonas sp. UWO 241]|nr:hypothetical protein FOA52_012022 [Chlamydomonas sp. UWO 241]
MADRAIASPPTDPPRRAFTQWQGAVMAMAVAVALALTLQPPRQRPGPRPQPHFSTSNDLMRHTYTTTPRQPDAQPRAPAPPVTAPPAAALDIPGLVQAVRRGPARKREHAAAALAALSTAASHRQPMINAGAIPVFIKVLRASPGPPGTTTNAALSAAKAIVHLVELDVALDAVLASGGMEPLLGLLGRHTPIDTVQMITSSLTNLAERSPLVRAQLASGSGLTRLVELLGPASSSRLQHLAALTLHIIAVDSPHIAAVASTPAALTSLVQLLQPGAPHVLLVTVITVLARIGNDQLVAAALCSAGVGKALTAVLTFPSTEVKVREHGASLLHVLAFDVSCRENLETNGVIPALVRMLEGPTPAGGGGQQEAIAALGILAISRTNQARIADAGAIAHLVRLLGSASPPAIQQNCAAALGHIAALPVNQILIVRTGVLKRLVAMLTPAYADVIHEPVVGTLQNLAMAHENYVAIVEAGAITALKSVINATTRDQVRSAASRALSNLAAAYKARAAAADAAAAAASAKVAAAAKKVAAALEAATKAQEATGCKRPEQAPATPGKQEAAVKCKEECAQSEQASQEKKKKKKKKRKAAAGVEAA